MTKRVNFAAPIAKRVTPAPGKGNKPKTLKMPATLVGIDIVTALRDPNLLGYSIKDLTTYQTWIAAAKAAFGLRMNKAELALFQQCAQRTDPPTKQFKRILLICGRRSGKSFLQAAIAVWLAIFRDYTQYLSKGEKATIFVIAADRKQARTIMRYIGGFLEAPMLKQFLVKEVAEAFELVNNVVIEVATASYKAVRGYTLAGVLADESAFWTDEDGRNPCSEIFTAITPGLLTIPGAPLIISTTPMGKRGYIGEMYDAAFADNANDHTLVWQAPSLTMNQTLDKAEIDLEYKLDPIKAAAEYGAQFRNDVDALLTPEVIDRATRPDRYELPYDDTRYYVAAIDASGGSSDSFTLAICHREGDIGVLDLIREVKPPFSPDAVCADFADCMRRYGVSTACADRYALSWVEEGFKRHSILIEHSDLDRTSIYASFLPLINSNRVELLDIRRLRSQLLGLERRASRVKEIIDHARGHHDDVANVAALALVKCVGELTAVDYWNWLASPAGQAQHNQNMLEQQLRYGGVTFPTPMHFPGA